VLDTYAVRESCHGRKKKEKLDSRMPLPILTVGIYSTLKEAPMTDPIPQCCGTCRNWRRTFVESQTGVCTFYGNGAGFTGGRSCGAWEYDVSRKGGYATDEQE